MPALVSRTSQRQQQCSRKAGALVETRRICRVGARQGHTQSGLATYDRRQGEPPFLEPLYCARPNTVAYLASQTQSQLVPWTLGVYDARLEMAHACCPHNLCFCGSSSDIL